MSQAQREESTFVVRHQRPTFPTESQFSPYRNTWLGPYSSEAKALEALEQCRTQPEFRDTPDGFAVIQRLYCLEHTHEFGDARETSETKHLGLYTTEARAQAAIARYRTLPGFREAPDGFDIGPCPLNIRLWESGFFTIFYDETDSDAAAAGSEAGNETE